MPDPAISVSATVHS